MVQPLRDSRDHYEELKQIDDAMTEVDSPMLHPFKYSIHLVYIFSFKVHTHDGLWSSS